MKNIFQIFKKSKLAVFILIINSTLLSSQSQVDLKQENCSYFMGITKEIGGRAAFSGTAILKDIEFSDGTIEWDIWTTGGRSYAGVIFRLQPNRDAEEFYVRPHKGNGLFPDAFQYTPVYHGVSCWQLSHGKGGTAPALIPVKSWVHFKLIVKGDMATLCMGEENPVTMKINKLYLGETSGAIGVKGPADGSVYFSNFTWSPDTGEDFPEPAISNPTEPGIISRWEISQPFLHGETNQYEHYSCKNNIKWKKAVVEENGLLNLTKNIRRNPVQPGWVYCKTTIYSEKDAIRKFQLGYSDYITVFVNGEPLMSSTNAYQSRDPAFAGLIGYFDEIFLPLKEGDNEVCLLVGEQFGGWGLMMRDGESVRYGTGIREEWILNHSLSFPESVAYDPDSESLFTSNFLSENGGSISRLSLDGEMLEKDWLSGIVQPTGIYISEGRLYIVDRQGLTLVDLKSKIILDKITIAGSVFLNDIVVTKEGVIYISDSGGNKIYRIINKNIVVWKEDGEVRNPNGLDYTKGKLIVGCSGDCTIKEIEIASGKITSLCKLPDGSIIDGLKITDDESILFSIHNGILYRLNPNGVFEELINTVSIEQNLADFEYLPRKEMIIVPGLYSNVIAAYSIVERKCH